MCCGVGLCGVRELGTDSILVGEKVISHDHSTSSSVLPSVGSSLKLNFIVFLEYKVNTHLNSRQGEVEK